MTEKCHCQTKNIFADQGVFSDRWISYFMKIAKTVSEQSKDPSTKVGAVIVSSDKRIISTGFNGFPMKFDDSPEKYADRPTKLKYVVHAEANAICQAASHGNEIKACAMFITLPPCIECSKLIIQSGISDIFCPYPETVKTKDCCAGEVEWRDKVGEGMQMLIDSGLTLHFVNNI